MIILYANKSMDPPHRRARASACIQHDKHAIVRGSQVL